MHLRFAFNVTGKLYEYALGHYLAWVHILDPQAAFQMGSNDAFEYYDSRSDSICPSPGANPRLCNWQCSPHYTITEHPEYFTVGVVQRLELFQQLFAAHKPSYLSQRFRTLIFQCNWLCSTALLCSLCVPLAHSSFLTLFCFLNKGFLTTTLPHRPASQSLFPPGGFWHIFSRHWFNCVVMFGVVNFLSRKLETDEIVFCSCCCF